MFTALIPTRAGAAPTDPPSTGGVGIRLLEAPVALQDDPRAQSYIIDNLPPGTELTRRIEVSNTGDTSRDISVYPGAATISDAGGFEVGDGAAVNELTTWMSLTPSEVTLAPGEAAEVTATIKVPADAPEGEQYAVVWAQIAGEQTAAGIQSVSRAGIRTYLSVGPGNGPPAGFDIVELTGTRGKSGAPQVSATVTNTGGRAIDPAGTLTLTDGPGGISAAPVTGSGPSIAPGKTGSIIFVLDPALPSGPWKADVEVKSGLVTESRSGSLTFPDEGTTTAMLDSTESDGIPAWGWAAITGAIALVAGIGTAIVLVRRKVT